MGRGRVVPPVKDGDWGSVRRAIARLSTIVLGSEATPTFAGITLGNTGLHLLDTDASHDLIIKPGSNLTADRILTLTTGDAARTITLSGDPTLDDWFDQSVKVAASPIFAGGEFTGVVTGIIPTTGVHLATKEYVDLAIGASFDLFLSDVDDGVVANTHVMYPMETSEDQTTVPSPSLSDGPGQLALSWLSEAGVPGTSTIREGVYDAHIHLNKNSGGATTTVYWELSYVDANGTSGKILICRSETSGVITTSEVGYNIHGMVADEIPLGATKRLLFEIYANVATGQNVTLTATLEGTHDSHISFMLPSSVWQNQGDVLDDLNVAGQVSADSEFLVGTGAGVFVWESGATLLASLHLGGLYVAEYGALLVAN